MDSLARYDDRRRAGDWSVVADVVAVRQQLPVPHSWMYGRDGDTVICVFDECGQRQRHREPCPRCFTDQEIVERVNLVKVTLSLDAHHNRPAH